MKRIFLIVVASLMTLVSVAQPQKKEEKPSIQRKGMVDVEKVGKNWFFLVPDSLVGEDLLAVTRFVSTPSEIGNYGGEEIQEQMVYFEVSPDSMLLLRARMIVNVADTTQKISRAVRISNENPIIAVFDVKEHKKGRRRIQVNGVFIDDSPSFGFSRRDKQNMEVGGLMGHLSYIEDIKTFPMNTEVQVTRTFSSSSRNLPSAYSTGNVTFRVNISFVKLPKKPMLRRYFDPRVGYFTNSFVQYEDDQQAVKGKTFITRWRLEPKNEEDWNKLDSGILIEPKKPIVYYIDPATPKQWRPYLIAGVNDWQKAFEKAGFKNAIRAEEWPENDTTMSMEDARYSVIRYLASPIENAYGPHVSDPRSGEIIESHICWYHNVMTLLHDWYMVQASSIDEAARQMHFDEELMGQLIRFVSSHEVGHTLGLRHNFGSSSMVPTDSLRSASFLEKYGHTPSIMDYARFNYVAQPEDNISREQMFPRINDYDMWAIEWGYRPMRYAIDEELDHQLEEPLTVAAQKNKRLWWGDGETRHNDPRRQTEDLGDDAVKSSEYGIRNLKRELKSLPTWTDETLDYFGENLPRMYVQIRSQFMRYLNHVAHNIYGVKETYRTMPMGGTTYEPLTLAHQRRALKFMDEQALNEPMWLRDMPYARKMTADPQQLTLSVARNIPRMLIYRGSTQNETWPINDYFQELTNLIMKEAKTGAKVSAYRKMLQMTFLNEMLSGFNNSGAMDADRPAVLAVLKRMQMMSKSALGICRDAETRAHWMNINDLIERALKI